MAPVFQETASRILELTRFKPNYLEDLIRRSDDFLWRLEDLHLKDLVCMPLGIQNKLMEFAYECGKYPIKKPELIADGMELIFQIQWRLFRTVEDPDDEE